jgi:hypothetical protein
MLRYKYIACPFYVLLQVTVASNSNVFHIDGKQIRLEGWLILFPS